MTLRSHSLIVVAFTAWAASLCVVPTLASRPAVAPPVAPVATAKAPPPAAPVEITDADCLDCHGDPEAKADNGHSNQGRGNGAVIVDNDGDAVRLVRRDFSDGTFFRNARSSARPTSSAEPTSTMRWMMPVGLGNGVNASEW